MNLKSLANKCKKYVKCDHIRITRPIKKMYLIIGFDRNTNNDGSFGEWRNEKNKALHFDYIETHVIASGYTEKELIQSVKEYTRLQGISIEDYIKELTQERNEILLDTG